MQTTNFRLLGGKLAPPGPPTAAMAVSVSASAENESTLRPPTAEPADQATSAEPMDIFTPPHQTATATGMVLEEPEGGSGLTPPSSPPMFQRQPITPVRQSSLLQVIAPASKGPFSTCVAETLVIGPNGVMSLAPLPPVLKLEELCRRGSTDEAIALVDEERRRGRRGEVDSDKVSFLVRVGLRRNKTTPS